MTAPNTGLELLKIFGSYGDSGYENPIQLRDTTVGFSIQKNYPTGIRFKPAKSEEGDDDVAVIWVVYEPHKRAPAADLIPLRLRIATMSKYRAAHWDYNFDDENCPTEDSVLLSKSTPRPLELSLVNEYYYSETLDSLVNLKGDRVEGRDVLDHLFPAFMFEIHVDIGRLAAFLADEAFEDQRDAFGRYLGDAQQVADDRIRRRSAPLAQDAL